MNRNVRDQSAHFGAALAAVLLIAIPQQLAIAGAAIGLALGIVREVTEWQNAPPGHGLPWSRGSLLDILFWTIGGAAAGAVLMYF